MQLSQLFNTVQQRIDCHIVAEILTGILHLSSILFVVSGENSSIE